jgi:effector-binding domain-containing protein
MSVEILNTELSLSLYGFAGQAVNRNYSETGFRLMNKMWDIVKSNQLPNKGINIWVYGPGDTMFAGVELTEIPNSDQGLEKMHIKLQRYASYKHIGPYSGLSDAYKLMRHFLIENNFKTCFQSLEIYGHWEPDEFKLETEIIMGLE